jgi:rare lipoprotein A
LKITWFYVSVCALVFSGCAQKSTMTYKGYSKEPSASEKVKTEGLSKKSSSSFEYNMKPYTVFGKTYNPTFVSIGEEMSGVASWYGPDFHGKKTANGEMYDMNANTAAHKTLPMNTIVKVTNLNNSKSTIVRVNDRGPFVDGRIIDLSYAAGKEVGIETTGTAPVRLVVLGFDGKIAQKNTKQEARQLSGIAVQIGAFRNKPGADAFAATNASVNGNYKAVVKTYDLQGMPIYRVMLAGFKSEAEARDFMKGGKFAGSFVVSLD